MPPTTPPTTVRVGTAGDSPESLLLLDSAEDEADAVAAGAAPGSPGAPGSPTTGVPVATAGSEAMKEAVPEASVAEASSAEVVAESETISVGDEGSADGDSDTDGMAEAGSVCVMREFALTETTYTVPALVNRLDRPEDADAAWTAKLATRQLRNSTATHQRLSGSLTRMTTTRATSAQRL